MNIVYSFDRNIVLMTLVSMYSVIKNNPREELHFFILQSDLTSEDIALFKKLADQYNNVEITVEHIDILDPRFTRLDTDNDPSPLPVYFRWLIPEKLKEYDRALHIDSDILCLGGISDMYSTNLDAYFVAAADALISNDHSEFWQDWWQWWTSTYKTDVYVSAGVIVMDLAKINDSNLVDKMFTMAVAKTKIFGIYNTNSDQTVFNAVFAGKIKILPQTYNRAPYNMEANEKMPVLLHLSESYKPLMRYAQYPEIMDTYWDYLDEVAHMLHIDTRPFIRNVLIKQSQRTQEYERETTRLLEQIPPLEERIALELGELAKARAEIKQLEQSRQSSAQAIRTLFGKLKRLRTK
jgi:lipopolysaccharide biosynthesis glycosyltransferase